MSICISHTGIWGKTFQREGAVSKKFLRWSILDMFDVEDQCSWRIMRKGEAGRI